MDDCPPISRELVQWLDRNFPLKGPVPGTPVDQVFYDSGWRGLVDRLITIQQVQEAEHVLA